MGRFFKWVAKKAGQGIGWMMKNPETVSIFIEAVGKVKDKDKPSGRVPSDMRGPNGDG